MGIFTQTKILAGLREEVSEYSPSACARVTVDLVNNLYYFIELSTDMPKRPDAHAGPNETTESFKALTPEEIKKIQAEGQRELMRQRGAEIAADAAKFTRETATRTRAVVGLGFSRAIDSLKTGLRGAWSGLGKAVGFSADAGLIGLGYAAHGKDKAVGVAEKVGAHLTNDIENRSEVLQGMRYVGNKADQLNDYVTEKAGAARDFVVEKATAAKEGAVAMGRAAIDSKMGQYTAKGLRYAGTGVGVALGAGAYAVAGPLLAWKNPAMLEDLRAVVKEKFPVAGMGVFEALRKAGSSIAEGARGLATRAWERTTKAWDGLKDWSNKTKLAAMERAGIASTEKLNKALADNEALKALLEKLISERA